MTGSRAAISAVFLVNGVGIGVWAAFVPLVKERLSLDDGALAVILFAIAAGAIVAMPLAGACVDRFGSDRITVISAGIFGLGIAIATTATAYVPSCVAAVILGAGNGAMDVAMNVNGVALQARSSRRLMSSLHGLFSVGNFLAAIAIAAYVATRAPHALAGIAVGAIVATLPLSLRALLVRDRRITPPRAGATRAISTRLLLLGVAAICGAVAEGTMVEWSSVYVRESLHAGISASLGGFAAYAIAMSASRFCGDAIVHRIGPVAVVRASGALGAAGLALALGVHTYPFVIAGFFVTGLGLANVSPLVYGAGATSGTSGAGSGVAVVTTVGYCGFLIGPALIGFTAQRSSIDTAFGLVAVFALAIALLASVMREREAAFS